MTTWQEGRAPEAEVPVKNVRRRRILSILVMIVLGWGGLTAVYATDTTPKLGLDLAGGTSVILRAPSGTTSEQLDQAVNVMRKRIEALGMQECFGEVQVPTETVVEVKNGKKREVRRKFFPGYVLVEMEMTDDAWHLVRNTPKVTGFVGAGKKPTPLTEEEVNQILHQSVATQEKPRPTEVFEKGERIRIADGPFASFNGVVEEVNFDRSTVKVMVTIFGRETPVEIEFRQVQKLS